jgi:hypothetical protein
VSLIGSHINVSVSIDSSFGGVSALLVGHTRRCECDAKKKQASPHVVPLCMGLSLKRIASGKKCLTCLILRRQIGKVRPGTHFGD